LCRSVSSSGGSRGADIASRSALLVSTLAGGALVTVAVGAVAETVLASRGKDLTFSSRTAIWEGVWAAIERRPLTGYGPGLWVDLRADPAATILGSLGFSGFHAHNGYLEVALQFGLVGLMLVLVLMALVFVAGLRELARDVDLGTFYMLFVILIATSSISEVTMLGIWLALLCAFQTVSAISGARRSTLSRASAHRCHRHDAVRDAHQAGTLGEVRRWRRAVSAHRVGAASDREVT
jgi:O-antigen ligase